MEHIFLCCYFAGKIWSLFLNIFKYGGYFLRTQLYSAIEDLWMLTREERKFGWLSLYALLDPLAGKE